MRVDTGNSGNSRVLKVSRIIGETRKKDSRLFCAGFTLKIMSIPVLVGIIDEG